VANIGGMLHDYGSLYKILYRTFAPNMTGVKHIIFDLGNVILNIDYDAPVQAFKQLGIANFENIFSKASQNTLSDDFETGHVSEEKFIAELLPLCNAGTTHQQVIEAWNSILVSFPLRRLQILKQLQLHYNMFLLSNTNILHERAYNKMLFDLCGEPSLHGFFDKVYLSHRIGLRKPNPAAWELILTENQLDAKDTLFLDDSPQHIVAAEKLGIRSIHITPENSMEQVFRAK
jgi:putative hydrolase of the HAD superfamily